MTYGIKRIRALVYFVRRRNARPSRLFDQDEKVGVAAILDLIDDALVSKSFDIFDAARSREEDKLNREIMRDMKKRYPTEWIDASIARRGATIVPREETSPGDNLCKTGGPQTGVSDKQDPFNFD